MEGVLSDIRNTGDLIVGSAQAKDIYDEVSHQLNASIFRMSLIDDIPLPPADDSTPSSGWLGDIKALMEFLWGSVQGTPDPVPTVPMPVSVDNVISQIPCIQSTSCTNTDYLPQHRVVIEDELMDIADDYMWVQYETKDDAAEALHNSPIKELGDAIGSEVWAIIGGGSNRILKIGIGYDSHNAWGAEEYYEGNEIWHTHPAQGLPNELEISRQMKPNMGSICNNGAERTSYVSAGDKLYKTSSNSVLNKSYPYDFVYSEYIDGNWIPKFRTYERGRINTPLPSCTGN